MSVLLTIEELADELNMPVDRTKRLARKNEWPCVRFSSKSVRYSHENVLAIVAMHADKPSKTTVGGLPGQTQRSRKSA